MAASMCLGTGTTQLGHAVGVAAVGDHLQAPGLQREPEIHRRDGIAEQGQVEHVAAREQVDTQAVHQSQRERSAYSRWLATSSALIRPAASISAGKCRAWPGPRRRAAAEVSSSRRVPGPGDGDDDVGARDGDIARRRAEAV